MDERRCALTFSGLCDPNDLAQHAVQISVHVAVPETQDHNAFCIKPAGSAGIRRRSQRVLSTIKLNRHAKRGTIKIEHIRSNWVLTTKAQTFDLVTPQRTPKLKLGVGRLSAKPACS
jgi:hypothetical protein